MMVWLLTKLQKARLFAAVAVTLVLVVVTNILPSTVLYIQLGKVTHIMHEIVARFGVTDQRIPNIQPIKASDSFSVQPGERFKTEIEMRQPIERFETEQPVERVETELEKGQPIERFDRMDKQQQINEVRQPMKILKPDTQMKELTENVKSHVIPSDACTSEKQNIYFLKVHKTGSTTFRNILQRFTMSRNLTVPVFMVQHPYPSHDLFRYLKPLSTYHQVYRESQHSGHPVNTTARLIHTTQKIPEQKINILSVHTVFNKQQVLQLFPPGVVSVCTLRHPLQQLKSSFSQWHLARKLGLHRYDDPVGKFLTQPNKYDRPLRASLYNVIAKIEDLYLSYTKNYVAYEFGFDLNRTEDTTYINDYLAELNRTFKVVIFTDKYTESLILLKHEMCWQFQDIVFMQLRNANYRHKNKVYSKGLLRKHRWWTAVDYKLYDMFINRHNIRVQQQGQLFKKEVEAFENVLKNVTDFCMNVMVHFKNKRNSVSLTRAKEIVKRQLIINKSSFNKEFSINGADCALMSMNENKLYLAERVWRYPYLCDKDFVKFIRQHKVYGNHGQFCGTDNMKYNIPYRMVTRNTIKTDT